MHSHSNHQSLLTQLYQILSSQHIRQNIDHQLRTRVQNILRISQSQNSPHKSDQKENIASKKDSVQKTNKNIESTLKNSVNNYLPTGNEQGKEDKRETLKDLKKTKSNSLMSTKNMSIKVKREKSIQQNKTRQMAKADVSKGKVVKKIMGMKIGANTTELNNKRSHSNSKSNIMRGKPKSSEKKDECKRREKKGYFKSLKTQAAVESEEVLKANSLLQTEEWDNNNEKSEYDLSFLVMIGNKQKEVYEEEVELEKLGKVLKQMVQEEKDRIEQCQLSIKSISHALSSKQENSNQTLGRKTDVRKKLEIMWNDVKALNCSISEAKQQEAEVRKNVEEEKELVKMYKQVIEELKHQLKIEKGQRDELRKKILVVRKNQEAHKIKSNQADLKNSEMIEGVKRSLQKWK